MQNDDNKSAHYFPDPETNPLEWWNNIPEDLKESLKIYELEENEEGIRKMLHSENFAISCGGTLEPLRNLTGLKELILEDCSAENLKVISTLTGLEDFTCDKYVNAVKYKDIRPLAFLKELKKLVLSGHAIDDITPLAKLSNLRYLVLNGNPIKSIEPVKNLVNLEVLHLSSKGVVESLWLEKLVKLKELSLNKVTVNNLNGLSNMKSLNYLWIKNIKPCNGEKLSLEPITHLKELLSLDLGSTPFESLEPLYKLPLLKNLLLDEKFITEELKNEVKRNMKQCINFINR
jgi:Leucine-rich repeat (LRR) protein